MGLRIYFGAMIATGVAQALHGGKVTQGVIYYHA
jgi:hypothetical protein